jgi:hypothetical protein
MKRPATILREITQNQARIAELRDDQVRIYAEIEGLHSANKANVLALVGHAIGQLDFARLNIDDLLSSISKLAEAGADHTDLTVRPVESVRALLRLSRNASASNLRAIKAAGLRWNGRLGGWTGHVTSAELDELRRLFGERVEQPEQASAAQDTEAPVGTVLEPVSAGVEAIAEPAEGKKGQVDEGAPSASAATIKMRLPGAFPVPRSLTWSSSKM